VILAGDVGGTNTRLALYESERGRLRQRWSAQLKSAEIVDFASTIRATLGERAGTVEACSVGVAGPIRGGRAKITNLDWGVDATKLARELGLERASLLNDLEANAWGVPVLDPADLLTLQVGAADARGNQALCSAGTGLGEAGVYFDGRAHHPFACEGGHATFAPRDELEVELGRYLAAKHGHVSWERVVSGPGLASLYAFLRDSGRAEEPAWLAERIANGDAGAEISRAALEGSAEIAVTAVDRFVSLWGAEAGNLALKLLATGGVFVGGGIAPKLAKVLARGGFVDAFVDKGRMSELLESMPVKVILDDATALHGAARHAARGLDGSERPGIG
jgi:glucokinase